MNRHTVLKAGLVLATTAHTAVATAETHADPLMNAIRAYQRGLDDFNKLAVDTDDDLWSDLADRTYSPHLDRLTDWTAPATTRESATEALRIALTDDGGVYGCDAAETMVRAALGYLETQA